MSESGAEIQTPSSMRMRNANRFAKLVSIDLSVSGVNAETTFFTVGTRTGFFFRVNLCNADIIQDHGTLLYVVPAGPESSLQLATSKVVIRVAAQAR